MNIELCDLCNKKIPDRKSGYSVGRGYLFNQARLCNTCGAALERTIKKIEAVRNAKE